MPDTEDKLIDFMCENLMIEGICRRPTDTELGATADFLMGQGTFDDVIRLQSVYAPDQPLRDRFGMNVRIGRSRPIGGTPLMRDHLAEVLKIAMPYPLHVAFEVLHPFMDGNGRTGRTLWALAMLRTGQDPFALSFLHRFYYQTLEHASR